MHSFYSVVEMAQYWKSVSTLEGIWTVYYMYKEARWQHMNVTPWSMAMLPLCYRFATALLPLCYRFAAVLLPLCCRFATALLLHCYHFATALLPLCCHVMLRMYWVVIQQLNTGYYCSDLLEVGNYIIHLMNTMERGAALSVELKGVVKAQIYD